MGGVAEVTGEARQGGSHTASHQSKLHLTPSMPRQRKMQKIRVECKRGVVMGKDSELGVESLPPTYVLPMGSQ